jgi:cholesterol oxidase
MSGYYEEGLDPSDELPQLGWRRLAATRDPNERDGVNATLLLVVSSSDIEATLKSDSHVFRVDGTVELPSLSVLPLEVSAGSFRIFSADSEQPHLRRMEYELHLHAVSGEDFFLFGEKLLRDDARFAIWTETTALRFWVYRGLNRSGTPLGGGFLRIRAADFIRQLQTMTITNAVHESDRLKWIARFGRFFAGNLFRTYGPVFAEKPLLDNAYRPRPRRKLRAPLPEVHDVVTQDCTTVRLTRYRAGSKGPVIIAPGFGVTAASYAIDTIETNLVEHLAERHYDVWLFDYRASPTLVSARTEFSLDDIARQDWPSAIRHVREATNTDVQVIAHCIGSMTLLMALLDGATGVRSVVCSQLALHAYGWWANQLAAGFDVATGLRRIGIRTPDIHYHERLLDYTDTLLRVAPVPEGEECESRTCRRIFSLFGPSYNHANLNQATHDAIAEMFGVTSITAFEHLSRIVRHGHAVDCRGGNSYICANRLNRLALPILFLAGAENREFTPRSSEKTWELLASANDFESFERLHSADSNAMSPGSPKAPLYERRVLEGYGHLDCFIGREAHRDVFPVINAFLARH